MSCSVLSQSQQSPSKLSSMKPFSDTDHVFQKYISTFLVLKSNLARSKQSQGQAQIPLRMPRCDPALCLLEHLCIPGRCLAGSGELGKVFAVRAWLSRQERERSPQKESFISS